jgi:heptosyltransferase-1
MPAVTEARRHRPHDRFAWIVEEPYAPLVRLHPAVQEVIPVALRRWRGALARGEAWGEMRRALRDLRRLSCDRVIDSQGLIRSAVLARLVHGERHGYDRASIREPLASFFYDVRHSVARGLHPVGRNPLITGRALGYAPEGPPDYGLDLAAGAAAEPYAILFHATARQEKELPGSVAVAVAKEIARSGLSVVLPWGTEAERHRSEAIAAEVTAARVPARAPLDEVARLIAGARVVVGVDTGLLHVAAALSVPLLALFAGSDPGLTGPVGRGPIAVLGRKGHPPETAEIVSALRALLETGNA